MLMSPQSHPAYPHSFSLLNLLKSAVVMLGFISTITFADVINIPSGGSITIGSTTVTCNVSQPTISVSCLCVQHGGDDVGSYEPVMSGLNQTDGTIAWSRSLPDLHTFSDYPGSGYCDQSIHS